MTGNDARDLSRSGRVAIVPVDGFPSAYRIDVDGRPVGVVEHVDGRGWRALAPDPDGRPRQVDGWRSRRHTAVRRLLTSQPRSTFDLPATAGHTGRDPE